MVTAHKMVLAVYLTCLIIVASLGAAISQGKSEQVWSVECIDYHGTIYTMEYSAIERYDLIEEIHMCGTDDINW